MTRCYCSEYRTLLYKWLNIKNYTDVKNETIELLKEVQKQELESKQRFIQWCKDNNHTPLGLHLDDK